MEDCNINKEAEKPTSREQIPVEPLVMAESIILRKWSDHNQQYEQCTLRELWENGFANGQTYQQYNQHLRDPKYLNGNKFHVEPNFHDDIWKAFWSDLKDAEIIIGP